MKKILVCLTLALCSTVFAGESDVFILNSQISQFNQTYVGQLSGGSLQFDNQKVSMTLDFEIYCPPGGSCPQLAPAPLQVNAAVVSSAKEVGCGQQTIARAVDGEEVTTITVTDYRLSICDVIYKAPVMVSYVTVTKGKKIESTLYFDTQKTGGGDQQTTWFTCISSQPSADNAYNVDVLTGGLAGAIEVVVHHSTIAGDQSETYLVKQLPNGHLVGAPLVLEGKGIRLSANFTTTPTPLGRPGSMYLKKNRINVDLLCQ